MRILMLAHHVHGGFGGIARFNKDFVGALARVISSDHPLAPLKLTILPRTVEDPLGPIPPGVRQARPLSAKLPYAARALLRATRGWDLVICGHINFMPLANAVRRLSGRKTRLVLILHGVDAWTPMPLPGADHLDLVIAVSALTRERFLSWAPVPADRCALLFNTVDTTRFMPGPAPEVLRDRLGLRGRRVILGLARLDREDRDKGYDQVMRALAMRAADEPDLRMVLVGDGTGRLELERLAADLGLEDRVIFPGRVGEDEKLDFYRLADCFVLCGRQEGFGIVLLEAMACGVPVVASSKDGSREAVADGALGEIADPDDSADIAAALARAMRRSRAKIPSGMASRFGPVTHEARVRVLLERVMASGGG